MNHNSSLYHGLVLCKQRRSIPSSPLPILVNLGLWLTEQKLIHGHVVFVYPPARTTESEVSLTHTTSSHPSPVLPSTKREQFLRMFLGKVEFKTPVALFPQWLLSAKPSVFLGLSCLLSFLIYCMSSAILLPISPSQLSVCFSPRFIILPYQPLVPLGFLHLISV